MIEILLWTLLLEIINPTHNNKNNFSRRYWYVKAYQQRIFKLVTH